MNKKGFTIIEIIITLSILGIVFALAFLKIDTDMFYMDKMADEFVMDVRYVQSESMKSPSNSYEISIVKDDRCYYVETGTVIEKTVEFKDRYQIDYSNENTSIGFTYEGIPKNAGTFVIRDTKTGKIKEVSIVPATGRTVIKE